MNASTASPFDQLLRHAKGLRARPRMPSPIKAQAPQKVATLIAFLQEGGPASTATLSHIVDVDSSNIIWGLLKAPRQRGQVSFDGKLWSACPGYDADHRADLLAAARLLRRAGWTVRAPGGAA